VPTVTCPSCSDSVEFESDWYGRRVACPNCDHRFVAEDPLDDRPRRQRSRFDDDDRPRRRSRREQAAPRNRGLFVVLGLLGLVGLVCLGCGGWGAYKFAAPIDYSGPWVTQPLPDRSCAMDFPRKPKTEDLSDPPSGVAGTKYLLDEVWPPDAAFAFGHIDAPVNTPGLFEDAYQAELAELKKATGAAVVRETEITLAGFRCKEAEFASGNSRGVYRLVNVTGLGRPRLLVIFAGGRNVSAADRDRFLNSFRMLR
jgi:DNA-directed RNA polymerase subunit RPC12/RpoP